MQPDQITIESIRAARYRIEGHAARTPLVRLQIADFPGEVWLKLENLQPVGSFKIRGAANAVLSAPPESLRNGVVTASAGNMAQGVAWMARALGIRCTVIVPEGAPTAKIDAIHRLGGRTIAVPYTTWWETLVDRAYPGVEGEFIHPVANADVIAGNGTIGLEIAEDLDEVDSVLVPVGGGGLASGIAAALRAVQPDAKVYGCEPSTAAPLNASLQALEPVAIDRKPSFVDGCGGRAVLPEMWPLVRELLAGAYAPTVEEIAAAVKLLAERAKIVAEGAGATALAAALGQNGVNGRVVCIVSGGCIDADKLSLILAGGVP
jgi:threonine dehydratase